MYSKSVGSRINDARAPLFELADAFREVAEAYDVLSDPQRRFEYQEFRPHVECASTSVQITPWHVMFRHPPLGIDQEIVHMFQMMEDMFRRIW